MIHNFTTRPITLIEFGDKTVESIHSYSVVITDDNAVTNGKRYLDFGSLCYSSRAKRSINRYVAYEGQYIDQATLAIDRFETVRKVIELARSMQTFISAVGFFNNVRSFFDWVDAQNSRYIFDDVDSMCTAYINYSLHLTERINTSGIRGGAIKLTTASQLQVVTRQVLGLSTGMHEKEIMTLGPIIAQSRGEKHVDITQPSTDIQKKTFATLVNFIEEAHRLLVESEELPMKLLSPGGEPFYLYSLLQETRKSNNAKISILRLLKFSATFPTWGDVKSHFGLDGPKWKTFHTESNYEKIRRMQEANNLDLRCAFRYQIANHAMTAGLLSFIAATGCNLGVAQDLRIDHVEIVPSTQGRRFYGAKPRADGKTVAPEFGARFTPIFKKILQIRLWMLNERKSNLVFPVLPKGSNNVAYIGTSAFQTLRALFKKIHPDTTWVPPVHWRKNVSDEYLTCSGGDTILTAEKLSNTPQTLKRSYVRPALEDFANQVSELFGAIHSAAIARTRHVNLISVHVLDQKHQEKVTGVGSCEKESGAEPQLANGFTTSAPQPNCRDPETCLFCDFYAVHADEKDIRRLLSLRYIIHKVKDQHTHDHWITKFGPTSHRIDEVLTTITKNHSPLSATVDRVRDEVDAGHMDPFWAIHFDTLVYIGAVV